MQEQCLSVLIDELELATSLTDEEQSLLSPVSRLRSDSDSRFDQLMNEVESHCDVPATTCTEWGDVLHSTGSTNKWGDDVAERCLAAIWHDLPLANRVARSCRQFALCASRWLSVRTAATS